VNGSAKTAWSRERAGRLPALFFLLLAGVVVFRMWFLTVLPLSGDEAYHWQWSRHPALGYYDHPPLTAYLIWLSTRLFGRSTEFTVRFPALLLLAGTALVCCLWARWLQQRAPRRPTAPAAAGFLAGLLILGAPLYAGLGMYMSTDPPFVFFAALATYLLSRALDSGRPAFWAAAGAALGFALLSKLLAVFLILGVGFFCLVSPRGRRWLRRPQPFLAGACSLPVILPWLWWNGRHGWITFAFNFVRRQESNRPAPEHLPEFVLGQAFLALSPGIFLLALLALVRVLRERDEGPFPVRRLAGFTALVPLAYFTYAAFWRRIGLHWTAAAWLGAIVCAACDWETPRSDPRARRIRGLKRTSVCLCLGLTIAAHLVCSLPPGLVARLTWRLPPEQQLRATGLYAWRYGWRELGNRVETVRNEMLAAQGREPPGVFVICRAYGMASSIAFYSPSRLATHLWTSPKVHGESYRLWDDYPALRGQDAVYVVQRERNARHAMGKLSEHFEEVFEPERFPIVVLGREVRCFFLLRCRRFNGVAPDFSRRAASGGALPSSGGEKIDGAPG